MEADGNNLNGFKRKNRNSGPVGREEGKVRVITGDNIPVLWLLNSQKGYEGWPVGYKD